MLAPCPSPALPANPEGRNIEERYRHELFDACTDCNSAVMIATYVQQIPDLHTKSKSPNKSSKLAKLRDSGLMGCLNDSNVTSENYKDILLNDK